MKRSWLFLAVMLLSATSATFAQQEAGDSELQFQGSLSLGLEGDAQDSGSAFVNYGRFFTERQELGLTIFGTIFNDGDLAGYGGPFYRYNFATGKTVPYLGVAAATSFGDFSSNDVLFNLEAGIRWYLQRNIAFTVAGTSNYDLDESDFSDTLAVQFGFSYIWGK